MKQGGPRKANQETTALIQVGDDVPRSDGGLWRSGCIVTKRDRVIRLAAGLDQGRGVWDSSDDCCPLARGQLLEEQV